MISKRGAAFLPLAALVVSFLAVFGLGRVFATADPAETPSNPPRLNPTSSDLAPAPNSTAGPSQTTAEPSPVPTVSRIHIVIVDINADQPAPGLLVLLPQPAGQPPRACMSEVLAQSWAPESTAWTREGDTWCGPVPPNGQLELDWVRTQ